MKKPTVSLILPVYNEEKRLLPGLAQAISYLNKQSYAWEIILVDDGSLVPVRLKKKGLTIFRLPKNMGKGAAIARGVSLAHGRYIIFSDIDFSVGVGAMQQFLHALRSSPIVIGSRRAPGAVIATHQPFMRETAGRIFTFLSNAVCRVRVRDATCGMKGFRMAAAKNLFARQKISRWVFDTEILFLARKAGIPITELPVVWRDAKGSKVTPMGMVQSIIDLAKIRMYEMRGLYN